MPTYEDPGLEDIIEKVLTELVYDDEIVVLSATNRKAARKIAEAVLEIMPKTSLNSLELGGLKFLVYHAVNDKRFFDREMPTLTGFTAEEFKSIAEKLPDP